MRSRVMLTTTAVAGYLVLSGCSGANPTLFPPTEEGLGGLHIESAEVLQAESWPVQVRLELTGTLPSACHSLDYEVTLPGPDGVIEVDASAVLQEGSECAQVAHPFRQGIGLGSYTSGDYQVLLNGALVGKVQFGGEKRNGAQRGGLERGPVFIDEAELLLLESHPVQVELLIRGALPTPCASLEWHAEPPDEQGRIRVEVFSVQDPAVVCIQVLQEIEERLPLGSYPGGSYSLWLNGDLVGEFDV